jgi:hypothetical protein
VVVSRSTAQLRHLWPAHCGAVPLVARTIAQGVRVRVHRDVDEAVQPLACIFQAFQYGLRGGWETGAYNCRKITGGTLTSLHAHGIALDANAASNPYRNDGRLVTDMPLDMIKAVRAVRTMAPPGGLGARVWGWGGDYQKVKDAMHFEVVASPLELALGIDWSTVRQPERDPARPSTWPLLQVRDRGPTVAALQRRLQMQINPGGGVGVFGPRTLEKVQEFQQSRALVVYDDGLVDLAMWTALLTGQPRVKAKDGPIKLPRPDDTP